MAAEVGPSYWYRVLGNTQHCVFWSFETSGSTCRTWTNSLAVPSYCIWWTYLWNPSIWHRGFLQPSGTWSDSSSCWFRDLWFLWSWASIFGIFYTDTQSQVGTHTTYFSGSLAISEQSVSRIQIVSYSGFGKSFYFRTHSSTSGPQFFVNIVVRLWAHNGRLSLCSAVALMREYNFFQVYPMLLSQPYFAHRYVDNRALIRRFSDSPGNNRFFAVCPISGPVCVCVYRYSKRFRSCFNEAGGFAIQYLSGFLDITRGAWTSVRNSVRVTFCQSLVACSKKARPIINYSTSWPRKLGQAIGIAFLEILNIVYSDLLKLQEVHAVLEQIRLLFQVIASDERMFEIHQSDIAGFYNQVEHDRILQAVDFAIYRFCDLQQVSLESSIQTHNHKLERTLHIFRGHWRSQSKQFREFKLSHIRDLVKIFTSELILPRRDPSFSSTSWCVYGLTMAAYLYVLLLH